MAWYDVHARTLPWRVSPADRRAGVRPDPYRVWLSEVMLQQTTVAHAMPYFLAFTGRWPTISALAAAPEDEVMAAWAGLGYYARARNLRACAKVVAGRHGGVFPADEKTLRALPGIGAYTAAAIAAIAFDRPANVVDANVERVIARLFAVETPLPKAKAELHRLAASLVADHRSGDWAQALMDLGATVCRPSEPLCATCPLARHCRARATVAPANYPRRIPKARRPHRHGAAFVLRHAGAVALNRRPPKGLLGGMLGVPTTDWRAEPWTRAETLADAPCKGAWRRVGAVEHVFTHFTLTLDVWRASKAVVEPGLIWTPTERALREIPTVFCKALRLAISR